MIDLELVRAPDQVREIAAILLGVSDSISQNLML